MLEARPSRLHSLTGLRYLAALAVVLVHVGRYFAGGSKVISAASGYGYIGVSFFFLLSGFVLTWANAPGAVGRFWLLRIARIWPLYLLLMVTWFVVVAPDDSPDLGSQTAALLMLQAWVPDRGTYFVGNYVSWSLSCEMFFYLLFPAVVSLVRRLTPRMTVAALAAVYTLLALTPVVTKSHLAGDTYFWLFYIFPPYRFCEFLLGMLLAQAAIRGLRLPRPVLGGWTAVGGLLTLLAVGTWQTMMVGRPFDRPLFAALCVPMLGLMLLSAASYDLRSAGAQRRVARTLGDWSFALFLVHLPLFMVAKDDVVWSAHHHPGVLGLVLYVAFATAAAAGLHYFFEKPIEQRIRRALRPGSVQQA